MRIGLESVVKLLVVSYLKNRLTTVDPWNHEGTGLYNFAWIDVNDNGFKYSDIIHPEKHKEEWNRRNLTENQKRLIEYFHKSVHRRFNPDDPKALMNQVVANGPNGDMTNMDLIARKYGKRGGKKFQYQIGLTPPRYMKSQKEVRQRCNFFTKENAKDLFQRYFTFNIENTWGEWLNEEEIIPVKGMPNDHNLQSEMYTAI